MLDVVYSNSTGRFHCSRVSIILCALGMEVVIARPIRSSNGAGDVSWECIIAAIEGGRNACFVE